MRPARPNDFGRSGDEGLDGVIKQDPLGLDRIYVQAWSGCARRSQRRASRYPGICGCATWCASRPRRLHHDQSLQSDAYNYAEKVAARLILIDGPTLASLLVEHNIGAQNSETFVLKRVDEDFFEEV